MAELDSQSVYNKFILRHMAGTRTSNVRLRKALKKKREERMTDKKVQVKPLSKVAATPNAKVRPSAPVANVEPFRSVQSGKKDLIVGVPKSRVVSSKAPVFPSPKKVIKIKGVNKNEEGGSKSLPVTASKKQLRGREVKSRVFDFLSSNYRKKPETKSMSSLKEKKVMKDTQKRHVAKPHHNDSSDMEIDEKSRCGSLEGCHGDEISQEPTRGESLVIAQVFSEASKCDISSLSNSKNKEKMTKEMSENEGMMISVSAKGRVSESNMRKAEENSLASFDDKENVSVVHENIEMSTDKDVSQKKAIVGSKHEDDSRKTQKKSSSTTTPPIVKYRKLEPTNPKPFKLRTDERGILKEANLDRKSVSPLKETAVKGGGTATRKHQNTDYYSSCDEKSRPKTQENQSGGIQIDNSRCKVQSKVSATTPYKNDPRPKLEKPNDVNDKFKRESEMMQRKVLRPLSGLPRKKEKAVIATKLSVIIEKPSDIIVKPKAAKPRKALTVPIETKFHRLHVPKDYNNSKRT